MQTTSTAGLRISPYSCLLELVMEPQRRLPNILERCCLARIQIKDGLIGLREVRDMRTPEVEFDGPLVGEPDQAGCVVDQRQRNQVSGRLRMILNSPEPIRSSVRAIPQVVRDSRHPLGEHTQRDRTVFEIAERDKSDLLVIM